MHIRYRTFRIRWLREQNVCNAAVRHEVLVHGHLQVLNLSISAEDLAEVRDIDVFGKLFDHDFGGTWAVRAVRTTPAAGPGLAGATRAASW